MTHPAHQHLLELGFLYREIPAEWEDTGGPENGPRISGHPGFDMYHKGDMTVYLSPDGQSGFELWDLQTGWPIAAHYGVDK